MKMSKTAEKEGVQKEKERILELCDAGEWEDAYKLYCESSIAVDYYKNDFERFVDRFKFSLKQRKEGWKFSLKYYLSGYLMITFGFAAAALTLRGMLSPYGDPAHAQIIPALIASMILTWFFYKWRQHLIR